MKLLYLRVLILLVVFGSLASADDMRVVAFSLSTTGNFSSGTPLDLAFDGSQFSGESDQDGLLILADLGMFTLTRPLKGADVYHPNSDTFNLDLAFLAPLGVEGNTTFAATLQGKVKRDGDSVFIDFGPTRSFTFANNDGSGGFDLTIDDINLSASDDQQASSEVLTGRITNAFDPPNAPATVPEPQAVLLLGTIVLLIGSAFRHPLAR